MVIMRKNNHWKMEGKIQRSQNQPNANIFPHTLNPANDLTV